jgi:hypothetical protein
MSDNLQAAWQSQPLPARLTIDTELLLTEVRRNQRYFTNAIFWRDVREVAIALLMVPVIIAMGIKLPLPWTWYLLLPGVLWIAGFMLIDRLRQRKRQTGPSDSLTDRLKSSLDQVEHQIWLLRNIVWWYILPTAIPAMLFTAHVVWNGLSSVWAEGPRVVLLLGVTFALIVAAMVFMTIWIYQANQRAVRNDLQPRRAELTALLASLQDEK